MRNRNHGMNTAPPTTWEDIFRRLGQVESDLANVRATANAAQSSAASKADDDRVKVLIDDEAKKGLLRSHGGVLTVLVVVLTLYGMLWTHVDSQFKSLSDKFDRLAPPTIAVPALPVGAGPVLSQAPSSK